MPKIPIIWGVDDYKGNYIELPESTYEHILKRHPYMADLIDDIKEVVESPHRVVESIKYPEDSLVHSRRGYTSEGSSDMWLHVPVSYQVGGYGYVTSAYTSPNKKRGKLVYEST